MDISKIKFIQFPFLSEEITCMDWRQRIVVLYAYTQFQLVNSFCNLASTKCFETHTQRPKNIYKSHILLVTLNSFQWNGFQNGTGFFSPKAAQIKNCLRLWSGLNLEEYYRRLPENAKMNIINCLLSIEQTKRDHGFQVEYSRSTLFYS